MALFALCQIVSLSCLGSRGKNILWHFCQAVKYGLIVTPAITRRLVGWCLPYFSSRPILVGVVICLHPYWCLLYFFQPSDIVFRAALVCISSAVHLPAKESVYTQKTQKSFVTLLPMAERLAIRGFRGNKIHILTLLPFVTAPVF